MKTRITSFLRFFLLQIFFTSSLLSFSQITIQSTMDGGIWSEGDTWIGGSPPAPIDNVIINGLVALDINTTCENLTVTPNGILQNIGDGTQELTIFCDVANAGIIKGISYIFTLNIQGNITNSGTWINYQTNLTGNTTQTLTTITPFGGDNLSSLKPSGNISTNDVLGLKIVWWILTAILYS